MTQKYLIDVKAWQDEDSTGAGRSFIFYIFCKHPDTKFAENEVLEACKARKAVCLAAWLCEWNLPHDKRQKTYRLIFGDETVYNSRPNISYAEGVYAEFAARHKTPSKRPWHRRYNRDRGEDLDDVEEANEGKETPTTTTAISTVVRSDPPTWKPYNMPTLIE